MANKSHAKSRKDQAYQVSTAGCGDSWELRCPEPISMLCLVPPRSTKIYKTELFSNDLRNSRAGASKKSHSWIKATSLSPIPFGSHFSNSQTAWMAVRQRLLEHQKLSPRFTLALKLPATYFRCQWQVIRSSMKMQLVPISRPFEHS